MPYSVRFKALWKCACFASSVILTSFIITLSSCGPGDDPDPEPTPGAVMVNEVSASGDDWVELYNSSTEDKNIGGYKIYDDETDKYTIPQNTTIPAGGFLVLICDGTGTGLHPNFKLSADGETVYLEDNANTLIDKVEFPVMDDGQSYARFPDGSASWALTGSTSKGASNNSANAPGFTDYLRTPLVPAPDDDVTISIKATSTVAITGVKLYYRFDGGSFTELNMAANGSVYTATIPAQNADGEVEYYIKATSAGGAFSLHPAEAPDKLHDYLLNSDPLPPLKLNELMASNTSCCPDPAGVDEFDDWIEIYNAGDTPIDIGGMYLSDNPANPFGSRIPRNDPASTTIPAKGFLVLWADETGSQGPLHLNFRLSASGETIGLYYIDGRELDKHTFGAQQENKTVGRSIDGAGTWVQFDTPTQNASNE